MTKTNEAAENFGSAVCYTPGPWAVTPRDSSGDNVFSLAKAGALLRIANVFGGVHEQGSEFAANARLIAAAPDLLEACMGVVNAAEADVETGNSDIYGEVATCIEAIKKATGV